MTGRWAILQLAVNRLTGGMTWRRRLLIVIFAAPVLFTAATLIFAVESAVYVARSVAVEGTVVQVYEWPGETIFDRGAINYEPIFAYSDNGTERRASVGSGHTSFEMAVGETASIRAIPGGTGNVRIDSWQGLWFVPVILAGFTVAAWAAALLLWFLLTLLFFRKDPSK